MMAPEGAIELSLRGAAAAEEGHVPLVPDESNFAESTHVRWDRPSDLSKGRAGEKKRNSWEAVRSHCKVPDDDCGDDARRGRPSSEFTKVELTKSCYNLAVVCSKRHLVPLMLVLATAAGQIVALYVVVCASPEYHFGNGMWLQPYTTQNTLFITKVFALVLNSFQAMTEFESIGDTARVLTHTPPLPMGTYRRIVCIVVLCIQYVFSVFVQLAGAHLVLCVDYPLKAFWITYYVYLTLNFDDLLCRFFVYLGGAHTNYQWTVYMRKPRSVVEVRVAARTHAINKVLFAWLPLFFGVAGAGLSLWWNVLPMTVFRYGFVSNLRPVIMLEPDLKLPYGCCGVTTWFPYNASAQQQAASRKLIQLHASVPCLSRNAPEDRRHLPIIHWVVWPSRSTAPSSLQVFEGRTPDGSRIQSRGHATARPISARQWLHRTEIDIDPNKADSIYKALIKDTAEGGTVGLYRHRFFYAAEIFIPDVPLVNEFLVYAVTYNPRTRALSPVPVASKVLHMDICPENCERCDRNQLCLKCMEGYIRRGRYALCKPCAPDCKKCRLPGTCEPDGCRAGYGWSGSAGSCLPCAGSDCEDCNAEGATAAEGTGLPCRRCLSGFALQENGTCAQCLTPRCKKCLRVEECVECPAGSLPVPARNGSVNECRFCAENCLTCAHTGEGKCDQEGCKVGFAHSDDKTCVVCPDNCLDCHDQDRCDAGMCKKGYGLEPEKAFVHLFTSPGCKPCKIPHCDSCDHRLEACDKCKAGYGTTPQGSCDNCAPNCYRCNLAGECEECEEGFVPWESACQACGDQCLRCAESGPHRCDPGGCATGWTAVPLDYEGGGGPEAEAGGDGRPAYECRPCSDPGCASCELRGPGTCDDADDHAAQQWVSTGAWPGPTRPLRQAS